MFSSWWVNNTEFNDHIIEEDLSILVSFSYVEKSTPPLILIDLRKYITFWETAKSLHRPYLLWDGIYQTCSSYVDVYLINYHSRNSPRERGKKKRLYEISFEEWYFHTSIWYFYINIGNCAFKRPKNPYVWSSMQMINAKCIRVF